MKAILIIIGVLLLLPGICGGFFMTISLPNIWIFASTGHGNEFGGLIVLLSSIGLLAGCLGLYSIVRSDWFSKGTSTILLSSALIISLATIGITMLYFFRLTKFEFTDLLATVMFLVIALMSVPLPIYLQMRK